MFEKIYVSTISQKNIENNPHNVHIFGTAEERAFQNRFNHVHTTAGDDSRGSQSGLVI